MTEKKSKADHRRQRRNRRQRRMIFTHRKTILATITKSPTFLIWESRGRSSNRWEEMWNYYSLRFKSSAMNLQWSVHKEGKVAPLEDEVVNLAIVIEILFQECLSRDICGGHNSFLIENYAVDLSAQVTFDRMTRFLQNPIFFNFS